MPPDKINIDASRPTNVVVRVKIPSGATEVDIELNQVVGSTREALALVKRMLMNTGPLQGPDDEEQP